MAGQKGGKDRPGREKSMGKGPGAQGSRKQSRHEERASPAFAWDTEGLGIWEAPSGSRMDDRPGGAEQVREAIRRGLSRAELQMNSKEAHRSWKRAWPFSRGRPL